MFKTFIFFKPKFLHKKKLKNNEKFRLIDYITNMDNIIAQQTIPLDYANSGNAAEIDKGIRDTIGGISLSILAIGIGLARIKSLGLFTDLNSRSMTEYIEHLSTETKMDRSSIYNWLNIGEAYIKYKDELDTIDFKDSDGPTKLPYLDRALASREKEEVFENIKNMSVREFANYAKLKPESSAADLPLVEIRGNTVYINGKLTIILSKNPGKRITAYFRKVIKVACEALEKGEVILPVRLHNLKEARRFGRVAERIKQKIRENKYVTSV